jgi:hypothetical protein
MKMKRQCPACHGYGGETEITLDDGTGPWMECGFCEGTGTVEGTFFFQVLGWLSAQARKRRASGKLYLS